MVSLPDNCLERRFQAILGHVSSALKKHPKETRNVGQGTVRSVCPQPVTPQLGASNPVLGDTEGLTAPSGAAWGTGTARRGLFTPSTSSHPPHGNGQSCFRTDLFSREGSKNETRQRTRSFRAGRGVTSTGSSSPKHSSHRTPLTAPSSELGSLSPPVTSAQDPQPRISTLTLRGPSLALPSPADRLGMRRAEHPEGTLQRGSPQEGGARG